MPEKFIRVQVYLVRIIGLAEAAASNIFIGTAVLIKFLVSDKQTHKNDLSHEALPLSSSELRSTKKQ